jgi:rhodanese-related sulfurtransferase
MTTKRTANAILFGWLLGLLVVLLVASGCTAADEPQVKQLSQQEFLSAPPAGALILDVRTEAEFSSGHVPGAINISHDELPSRLSDLDSGTDRPVVVYCRSGKRAGIATAVLLDAGYTNVLHLEGDMNAWIANGLPTE